MSGCRVTRTAFIGQKWLNFGFKLSNLNTTIGCTFTLKFDRFALMFTIKLDKSALEFDKFALKLGRQICLEI